MRVLFWIGVATVAYAYAGYALLLAVLARISRRPVRSAPITPPVSIIMAAHNEAANLPAKLANLRHLRYPADKLQLVVASDGSTDATNNILLAAGDSLVPVLLPVALGKANALNHAVAVATGEILIFMDVRQTIDPDAILALVADFADPEVGAVSGELLLETSAGEPSPEALGIYWKIEKLVRRLESETGSVVGATGALYALRRELYRPAPTGTLLDDVLIPMGAARAGRRILFQPAAIARDRIFAEPAKEFRRKVRTLTGNYQLLQLAPWLLSPANPLLFRLLSHKLLRLAVPALLVIILLASALAPGRIYRAALLLQVVFYGLALVGALLPATRRSRAVAIPYTFTMLNCAAALALYNFLAGRTRWA